MTISYVGGSTGNDVTLTYISATSLTLTSSDPSAAVYGETLTFTATVNPGAATGTVTFTDTTTGKVLASNVPIASGIAMMTTSSLAVGSQYISATYSPSSTAYISSKATFFQAIAKSGTATVLSSSLNPSTFGGNVTFTASVTPSGLGSGVPTGTVTFYDSDNLLMTEPLTAGTATYTTSVACRGFAQHYGGVQFGCRFQCEHFEYGQPSGRLRVGW